MPESPSNRTVAALVENFEESMMTRARLTSAIRR